MKPFAREDYEKLGVAPFDELSASARAKINLQPAHAECNIRKGAKWELTDAVG